MKLDNIPEVRISGLLADFAGFAGKNDLPPIKLNTPRMRKLKHFFDWAIETEAKRSRPYRSDRHQLRLTWSRYCHGTCSTYSECILWSAAGEFGGLKMDEFSRSYAKGADHLNLRIYHGYRYISFRWRLKG